MLKNRDYGSLFHHDIDEECTSINEMIRTRSCDFHLPPGKYGSGEGISGYFISIALKSGDQKYVHTLIHLDSFPTLQKANVTTFTF